MKAKAIVGVVAVAGVVAVGYFVYRYYSAKQAATVQQQHQTSTTDQIGGLIKNISDAGGITGLFGSLIG